MIPFQITFLDFPESDAVWMAVQNRVEKLEHFFSNIIRCEVVISCPHRHRHADRLYQVQIHLSLPGEDVIISHHSQKDESHRDVYVAIRDSFRAAERQLQDRVQLLRREVKTHPQTLSEGKVARVFPDEGYGFLETQDGREIYFGDGSLINKKFDHLHVGQKVRFLEVPGEKGPLATSMSIL